MGVGDDSHGERVCGRVAYGQRNAVDRNRTFVNGEVSALGHSLVKLVFECVISRTVGIAHVYTLGCAVYMTLHDVSVESAVHYHRALYVHLVAYLEQSEVRSVERFLHSRHRVVVAFDRYNGQANAVMSYALVDFQFVSERACQREVYILLVVFDGNDSSHFFYYTGKHLSEYFYC